MSYKPDEATLTSYLYGELSRDESDKVEEYLSNHPEIKEELDGLSGTRQILGKFQDREVVEPTFAFGDSNTVIVSKRNSLSAFAKTTISVAASISLLLLIGYLTKTSIDVGSDGLQVSFSNAQPDSSSDLNEADLRSWMQETLNANNQLLLSRISEIENDLDNRTQELRSVASRSSGKSEIDQQMLDQYVQQLEKENKDIIFNLLEASGRSQKQYMDALISDFANYLETQRQNDLTFIQENMLRLAGNPDSNELEEYRTSE